MSGAIDWKKVGKSLQEARKNAGFKSAQAFAEHIGMKTSAYTEYEQGRRKFNYEQAWSFADMLNCSLDDLGGRDWPSVGAAYSDPRQAQLNAAYERVNEAGKERIAENADDIAGNPKYTESGRAPQEAGAGNPVQGAA